MTKEATTQTAPVEALHIYRPVRTEEGVLIGLELVETYEIRPSDIAPPLGARLQELEFLTGEEHLSEPVEHADGPRGLAALAESNKKALGEAEGQARAAAEAQAALAAQAEADASAEQEAAAKARIAQLVDPEGYARAAAVAAIEAEHESLVPFASEDEVVRLEAVKAARIAELGE